MKVLLPINLARWRSPIATLLRACVQWNPDIEFHSFCRPLNQEDALMAREFWKLPNLKSINILRPALEKYDIIHIASLTQKNCIAGRVAKIRSFGKASFLATINLEIVEEDSYTWRNYQKAMNVVDYFAAVSETVKRSIIADVGDRFTSVIPNGFDETFYDPSLCEPNTLPPEIKGDRPVVMFVSALEPRKNPDFFIRLSELMPEVQFVAMGYVIPGMGEGYEKHMKESKNVTWLGHVDRSTVRNIAAISKALVFPSNREGLPLSVIECMGMGIPTLAQPKSSLPELITDGNNGFLIDLHDIDAWRHKLNSIIEGTSRLLPSEKIRSHAIKRYSFQQIGQNYGKLYKHIRSNH